MSRVKLLGLAAISWLSVGALLSVAQADTITYNMASDFAATYSTSAIAASATDVNSWGPAAAGNVGWSAGLYSFNYVDTDITTLSQVEALPSYYNNALTGAAGANVPWQFYALTNGTTIQQFDGLGVSQVTTAGSGNYLGATLPSQISQGTVASGTYAGQHYLQIVAHNETLKSSSASGPSTTAIASSTNIKEPGSGNSEAYIVGVYYNYSSYGSNYHNPNSLKSDSLALPGVGGPDVVRWTAPSSGTIDSISTLFMDPQNNGTPSPFIVMSAPGFASPTIVAGDEGYTAGQPASYQYDGANPNAVIDTLGGTTVIGTTAYSTATGWSGSGTAASYSYNWSGSISVAAGETIDFVSDGIHDYLSTHANHFMSGESDVSIVTGSVVFTATPEPSSVVLMSLAGVGLAFTAWKRRKVAAA
ncbi:MAG TPA: PEP-CTERM sorting domain-containing protein [Pirellulales bacterium]|jgi:hypothetical protein|nr:PEP-CTERM sorting domain-containing protein [Pirellulales bacterium]